MYEKGQKKEFLDQKYLLFSKKIPSGIVGKQKIILKGI